MTGSGGADPPPSRRTEPPGRRAKARRRGRRGGQVPRKTGLRFSAKARRASLASSEPFRMPPAFEVRTIVVSSVLALSRSKASGAAGLVVLSGWMRRDFER